MGNRTAAGLLAVALLVAALIAGTATVHANDVSCGSAFAADDSAASTAQFGDDIGDALNGRDFNTTDYEADCANRRTTQLAFVIPLLVVGALGGGYLLLTARRSGSEGQSPSAV